MSLMEGPPAPRRVVLLDDSRTVLAALRVHFLKHGFEVRTALDASELDPAEVQRANLIVVDVQMEQVFGDDVVSFLRDSWGVKAPIFLYSSLPREELEQRGRASGATGVVCKAEGADTLLSQVLRVVGAP